MSNLLRVFVLTKREQRVVIVIMLVVVGATLARHYRNDRSHVTTPTSISSTPAPTPSVEDDDAAAPDESP